MSDAHHDDKAHSATAERPWQFGLDEWRAILRRAWQQRSEDDISARAAAVAFSAMFAIPTLLIAVISIYGLIASPAQITDLVERAGTVLPEAATELLTSQLNSLIESNAGALSIGAAFGFLGALWSVSGGVNRVRDSINEVYGEQDTRPWYTKRAWAAVGSLIVIFVIVTSVLLIALLPAVLTWLGVDSGLRLVMLGLRWLVLGAMMLGLLGALYRVGPKRTSPSLPWISVGTVIAAIAWVVMSVGFGIYAQNFGSYNATYGSLGSVIIFLMWLYLSAYIVLMAGELNSEMEHETLADTTVGEEEPFGSRGAHVADTTPDDLSERVDIDTLDAVHRVAANGRLDADHEGAT